MADDGGRLAHLLRWCGMGLVAAGVLMVVATPLHPGRETYGLVAKVMVAAAEEREDIAPAYWEAGSHATCEV